MSLQENYKISGGGHEIEDISDVIKVGENQGYDYNMFENIKDFENDQRSGYDELYRGPFGWYEAQEGVQFLSKLLVDISPNFVQDMLELIPGVELSFKNFHEEASSYNRVAQKYVEKHVAPN